MRGKREIKQLAKFCKPIFLWKGGGDRDHDAAEICVKMAGAAQRQLKASALAAAALTDTQIQLPILKPAIPLAEVLEYRQRHPEALTKVGDALGQMARRIQAEPWSADFEREIEIQTLPDLLEQLNQATKSHDAWLGSQRTKQWLKAAGIAVGAASTVLAVVTRLSRPLHWPPLVSLWLPAPPSPAPNGCWTGATESRAFKRMGCTTY